jgi:hypothetical protein
VCAIAVVQGLAQTLENMMSHVRKENQWGDEDLELSFRVRSNTALKKRFYRTQSGDSLASRLKAMALSKEKVLSWFTPARVPAAPQEGARSPAAATGQPPRHGGAPPAVRPKLPSVGSASMLFGEIPSVTIERNSLEVPPDQRRNVSRGVHFVI